MSENQTNEHASNMEQAPSAAKPEESIQPEGALKFVFDMPRFGKGGERELDAILKVNPQIKTVIVDSLMAVRGPEGSGSDQSEKNSVMMDKLKTIADENAVAMVVAHHMVKNEIKDPFDVLTGSNLSNGARDNLILFTKDNREAATVLKIFPRDKEDHEVFMKFDNDTKWWMEKGSEELNQISPEQQEILDFLQKEGQSLKLGDVAGCLGKKKPNVYKLMNKLVSQGLVEKVGFGKYRYPDNTQASTAEDSNTSSKEKSVRDCRCCYHFDGEGPRCNSSEIALNEFITETCCENFKVVQCKDCSEYQKGFCTYNDLMEQRNPEDECEMRFMEEAASAHSTPGNAANENGANGKGCSRS